MNEYDVALRSSADGTLSILVGVGRKLDEKDLGAQVSLSGWAARNQEGQSTGRFFVEDVSTSGPVLAGETQRGSAGALQDAFGH